MNPHCRIGRVRPKGSPNLIEVIPAKRGMKYRQEMTRNLQNICDDLESEGGIAGLVIVGWTFNGGVQRAVRIHSDSFIAPLFLPNFIADILRGDIIESIAENVMER